MRDPGKAPDPVAALLAVQSRGDVRAAGAWIEGPGRSWRGALVTEARKRGAHFPDDWDDLDGRRLLRLALSRADAAQVRTTPQHLDEAFICANCKRDVPEGGRRPRDHCPWCLHSRHEDIVPGDRAAGCGGMLAPVGLTPSPKGLMIEYRCTACGTLRRNRVLDDLAIPDDPAAVHALVGRPSG